MAPGMADQKGAVCNVQGSNCDKSNHRELDEDCDITEKHVGQKDIICKKACAVVQLRCMRR